MALSQASLLTFLRSVAGIPANYLPDADPQIGYAYAQAQNIVNLDLQSAPATTGAWSPYEDAVYNLSTHLLIEFAADQSYALSAISWSAGVVSATTAAASQLLPGDVVAISGVSPLAYSGGTVNGVRQTTVTVYATPDTTHFQYALQPDPGTATLLAAPLVTEQYFAGARKQLKIGAFAPGVVTSANDLSTGTGLLNPDFMRGLTLFDLQLLKTTYGRAALSIMQRYGPAVWGVN